MFVYKTLVFFLYKLPKHDYVKLDVITCSFIRRIYLVSYKPRLYKRSNTNYLSYSNLIIVLNDLNEETNCSKWDEIIYHQPNTENTIGAP